MIISEHLGSPWWTSHPPFWSSAWFYLSYWISYYLWTIRQFWCNVLLQISSLFLCLVMEHSGQGDLSSVIKEKRHKSEKITDMVKSTEEASCWTDSVSLLLYFFLYISSFSKFSPESSKHSVMLQGGFGSYLPKNIWKLFCLLLFHVYSPQQVILKFLGQMVDALFYIHKQNIFHRWVEILFSLIGYCSLQWLLVQHSCSLRGSEFYCSKRGKRR